MKIPSSFVVRDITVAIYNPENNREIQWCIDQRSDGRNINWIGWNSGELRTLSSWLLDVARHMDQNLPDPYHFN